MTWWAAELVLLPHHVQALKRAANSTQGPSHPSSSAAPFTAYYTTLQLCELRGLGTHAPWMRIQENEPGCEGCNTTFRAFKPEHTFIIRVSI